MWQQYNPNPEGQRVGDCTVRSVSCALGEDWRKTYIGMAVEGLCLGDMPSANRVWGAYLERQGFKRHLIDAPCATCYNVRDFCRDHPKGTFVLAISGHVVCIKDGTYWDSWDSGDEVPIYYWSKEE